MPQFNGLHVPPNVAEQVERITLDYKRTHNGFLPPTHKYCGMDSERAAVGLPGHCEPCAIVGHLVAHPDFGCGDVHCNDNHS